MGGGWRELSLRRRDGGDNTSPALPRPSWLGTWRNQLQNAPSPSLAAQPNRGTSLHTHLVQPTRPRRLWEAALSSTPAPLAQPQRPTVCPPGATTADQQAENGPAHKDPSKSASYHTEGTEGQAGESAIAGRKADRWAPATTHQKQPQLSTGSELLGTTERPLHKAITFETTITDLSNTKAETQTK